MQLRTGNVLKTSARLKRTQKARYMHTSRSSIPSKASRSGSEYAQQAPKASQANDVRESVQPNQRDSKLLARSRGLCLLQCNVTLPRHR